MKAYKHRIADGLLARKMRGKGTMTERKKGKMRKKSPKAAE